MVSTDNWLDRRSSGILLHPTSLPGPYGTGDLGAAAYRFAEFLAKARQSWWQMLPVGPPGADTSPYGSCSSFAVSPLLVSLEKLVEEGCLRARDLQRITPIPSRRVRYQQAARLRERYLRLAFDRFERTAPRAQRSRVDEFCTEHRSWLDDFALYCALKQAHRGRPWSAWTPDLRRRRQSALRQARRALAEEVRYHQFVQYHFQRQWQQLRRYCARRGIGLIGDVPIFVAEDGAEVWAHPEIFHLDGQGRPTVVAGTPPDYFSRDGQKWPNPVYRWNVLRKRRYDFWRARFAVALDRFDVVRLDHFIGFLRYWEVKASARTARGGRFVAGPGADFFAAIERLLGKLPFIAEDLGVVTPEVKALREQFSLPGMRVLQFAFGDDPEAPNYQPHNYVRHAVAYTGTHDNDTTVGWFRDTGSARSTRSRAQIRRERELALRYLASDGREIHWDMIRACLASVADTAIVPLQDVLGLGSSARMNQPGTVEGNWEWRFDAASLTDEIAERLAQLTETYGRATGAR